jgi:DNA invertase Pin-like site-specific DNA recombinase
MFEMVTGGFISYLRASSTGPGQSGLCPGVQREAISAYLSSGAQLLEEYVEIETGRGKHSRTRLQDALKACAVTGATLVIAQLDRLSSDAVFLRGLHEAGAKFAVVDMPEANESTVAIMALVAQRERVAVSRRTKAALAAARARGVKLGTPDNLTREAAARGRACGMRARISKADEFARRRYPDIARLRGDGLSLCAVARQLNSEGVPTARGKRGAWTARAVKNVVERVESGEQSAMASRVGSGFKHS